MATAPLFSALGAGARFEPERDWLKETRQIDVSDSKVRITAMKLTQALQSVPPRIAAIQDFVRRMPFAASPESNAMCASDVLRAGSGDCHSKGVLFTALCRAAGIPARLLFVTVETRFLTGILRGGPPTMPHAVSQVLANGNWLSTDGYVVDPPLFEQAKRRLRRAGLDCGWGIVSDATPQWGGQADCLQQFAEDDVVKIHGHFDEPAHFYAGEQQQSQHWLNWLKFALGAHMVNRRVAQVRRGTGK